MATQQVSRTAEGATRRVYRGLLDPVNAVPTAPDSLLRLATLIGDVLYGGPKELKVRPAGPEAEEQRERRGAMGQREQRALVGQQTQNLAT